MMKADTIYEHHSRLVGTLRTKTNFMFCLCYYCTDPRGARGCGQNVGDQQIGKMVWQ